MPCSPRRSEALSVAGYTYALLGENYCSGIPFTDYRPDGTFAFGQSLSTTQVFERSLAKFDSALSLAGGDAQALRLSAIAVAVSIGALMASEWLVRRADRQGIDDRR